jgi:hypothetical protein
MIRLIGLRWKHGNVCSREVLIVRGLALCVVFVRRQIRAYALLAQPATPAKADTIHAFRRIRPQPCQGPGRETNRSSAALAAQLCRHDSAAAHEMIS